MQYPQLHGHISWPCPYQIWCWFNWRCLPYFGSSRPDVNTFYIEHLRWVLLLFDWLPAKSGQWRIFENFWKKRSLWHQRMTSHLFGYLSNPTVLSCGKIQSSQVQWRSKKWFRILESGSRLLTIYLKKLYFGFLCVTCFDQKIETEKVQH